MKINETSPQKVRSYNNMQLRIVFEPSDEGGYTVFVPSLPGCISEGDTLQEARENIHEAIALYLEPAEESYVSENVIVEEIPLHLGYES
jgi:predicted RNase H-like HicB family nuclease